ILMSARKVRYDTQPICADWPAKSAIVTGPDRFLQDTSPSSILPSMRRLKSAISAVLASALPRLSSGPYCTRTSIFSACEGGMNGAAPMRPTRISPALTLSGTTSSVRVVSPRSTVSCSAVPGRERTAATSDSHESIGLPSTRAMRSPGARPARSAGPRSEEHTSELQSHSDLVCRLLLEKKKKERRSDDD